MVREGIAIYGCPTADYGLHLRPAMQFETRVSYVKAVAPGDTVGYGRAFLADRPLRVATLRWAMAMGIPAPARAVQACCCMGSCARCWGACAWIR